MAKLTILRGLPGSGKTTFARVVVSNDPERMCRINRDDLRDMMHHGAFIKGSKGTDGTERSVIAVRDAAIKAALLKGIDVVCDDTNLPNRTVRDLVKLARSVYSEYEIVDFTNVSLEGCIKRDAERERSVGEDVIRDLWTRFVRDRGYPLPFNEPEEDLDECSTYAPDSSKPKAIIVDIDGTIALHGTRSPYDESRVSEDRPNHPVLLAISGLSIFANAQVIFVSARTDACRDATLEWLNEKCGYFKPSLFMRKEGDCRKDVVVKREIFDAHIRDNYNVIAVFDDRNQVVDMWRSMGLTVFQVADGDF